MRATFRLQRSRKLTLALAGGAAFATGAIPGSDGVIQFRNDGSVVHSYAVYVPCAQ